MEPLEPRKGKIKFLPRGKHKTTPNPRKKKKKYNSKFEPNQTFLGLTEFKNNNINFYISRYVYYEKILYD